MGRTARSIGSILAVRLLGRARICQTVRLNRMYQATWSDSWTDGDFRPPKNRLRGSDSRSRGHTKGTRRRDSADGNLEATMAGVVVVVIIALFLGGIAVGVIAAVAVSVRREDRRYSLGGDAPDRVSQSARRLNGVGRRDLDPEFLRPFRELVH